MSKKVRNIKKKPEIALIKSKVKGADALTGMKSNTSIEDTDHAYWFEMRSHVFDATLLDRSKVLWQEGNWEALIKLDLSALEHHPDRAKLAVIVSSAWQQVDDQVNARKFAQMALDWGCDKKVVTKILISGVYNTLGRVFAINKDEARSMLYFRQSTSIASGNPVTVANLRARNEFKRIGISAGKSGSISLFNSISFKISETEIKAFVNECINSLDVHAKIDGLLLNFLHEKRDRYNFFVEISNAFLLRKDHVTALHFLSLAEKNITTSDEKLNLSKRYMSLGRSSEATDLLVQYSLDSRELSINEKSQLLTSYEKSQKEARSNTEHGHEVLISYLKPRISMIRKNIGLRKPVLIEIGTTRENVYGQGSTCKIAEFCKAEGVHFITVDMDPHNTQMASELFLSLKVNFEAINQKGENFLRDYAGPMDFVFLDAYDFDHGKHSELRQSRYVKYLGNPIDEKICHQMHLDCAESLVEKLSGHGIICIDDTWLDNMEWCAKGTLAVPYLINHGFKLIEARNKAALLSREFL